MELRDGRLVTGGLDNDLRVWNLLTGVCERVIEVKITTLCYRVSLLSFEAFICIVYLQAHVAGITCLAQLHDGRVASGKNTSLKP